MRAARSQLSKAPRLKWRALGAARGAGRDGPIGSRR